MATTPNLEKMSLDELKNLRKELDKAIAGYEARQRRAALAAAEAAAREAGFSLSELTAGVKSSRKSSSAPPKYRHPENPALTWSGRGRQPSWFRDLTKEGTAREDLEIA